MSSHLFDTTNIYADLATNHEGNPKLYDRLVRYTTDVGAIPKIQLFSRETFDRTWTLPTMYVPSVFRPSDIDFAMQHPPLALKIASVESTYKELVKLAGQTGLPLLISTGGMNADELVALCELVDPFSGNVCLMHCVSIYPSLLEQACMARISLLADIMDDMLIQPYVGWSSHHSAATTLKLAPIAMAYDANQIEVHVKLDEQDVATPDKACAMSPERLEEMSLTLGLLSPSLGDPYDDDYEPPDRAPVLVWRRRWQEGL
jgi:sialic acid synthase SpsE